jgi:hypothetical protein
MCRQDKLFPEYSEQQFLEDLEPVLPSETVRPVTTAVLPEDGDRTVLRGRFSN